MAERPCSALAYGDVKRVELAMALAHGPLAAYLRAGALSDDETGQPIRRNASTPHLRASDINPATAALIREREWLLEHVAATWVDRPHAG